MKKFGSGELLAIGIAFGFLIGISVLNFGRTEKNNLDNNSGQTVRFWKDLIETKDYSSTKWKLTEKGKVIIEQARDLHKAPMILKQDKRDDGLCAGYLFELSALLWGKDAPTDIGMRDPRTHKAASAWELPYGYWYRGGSILTGVSDKIKQKPLDYVQFISNQDFKNIFFNAFSEASLLGDIGFLYKYTTVLHQLGSYGNYNSHITKNFGISEFSYVVKDKKVSAAMTISNTLGCDPVVRQKLDLVLPHYQFIVNGQISAFSGDQLRPVSGSQILNSGPIVLQPLDTLKFKDISLIHFYHTALVDSLLQLVCQGEFYPVNVTSINAKFIEKI